MALNPNIILSGRQPDFVNVLARSNQAAAGANQLRDQNAMRDLYRTQGPGIVAGEPGAMNALAGLDPRAAIGMQATQQQMGQRQAQEARAVEKYRLELEEYGRGLSAQDAEAQRQEVEEGLKRGIGLYQAGDLPGLNALMEAIGEAPMQSLEEFPAKAALYGDALEMLTKVAKFGQGTTTTAMQTLDQRAAAAGMQPGTPDYQQFMASGGKAPTGMRLSTGPDGSVTFEQGAGIQNEQAIAPVSQGTGRTKPGWEQFADPATGERTERPIQGGPVWNEYVDAAQKTRGTLESFITQDDIVMDDIDRALAIIEGDGIPTTGIAGALGSALPGTPMYALGQILETIRGNIGFDKLADMRANSPTGGALGNVSEQENRTLQATSGSLAQANRASDLAYNLRRIRDARTSARERLIRAYDDDFRQVGVTFGGAGKGLTADEISGMTRSQLLTIKPAEFGTMDADALTAYIAAFEAQQ